MNGLGKVGLPKLGSGSTPNRMTFSFQPTTGRRHEEERRQGRLLPPMVGGEEQPVGAGMLGRAEMSGRGVRCLSRMFLSAGDGSGREHRGGGGTGGRTGQQLQTRVGSLLISSD